MGNYQNPDTLIKTIMSRSFSLSNLAIKAHLLLIKLVITNMKENEINLVVKNDLSVGIKGFFLLKRKISIESRPAALILYLTGNQDLNYVFNQCG